MKRFSIRALMAAIVVTAIGLAALRSANDLWSGTMLLAALTAVGTAMLAAIFLRGRDRAWWTGYTLFSTGYCVFAFGSSLAPHLPTTHLLYDVHKKATNVPIASFEVSRIDRNKIRYRVVRDDGEVLTSTVSDSVAKSMPGPETLAGIAPNMWRTALPGAANYNAFVRVGHSLFAFMAGILGGAIAVWFDRKREQDETA